jgi:glycosyltransferase involved in cell wall biosynthesis
MKVGLFTGNIKETDGGAYTFVSEVIGAFSRVKTAGELEFVVLHNGMHNAGRLAGSLPTLDLWGEKPTVQSPKEKFFQRFRGSVEKTWDAMVKNPIAEPWDARVCKKHGVEFLVRLVPWCEISKDIPYAAVIWDLQHRMNPWFPEVSRGKEWTSREESLSTLCRRASLLFTSTEQGASEITNFYQVPEERIRVLPFPCPRYALEHDPQQRGDGRLNKFKLPTDFLFYPAQYWPHKNHVAVLEACRLVRERLKWNLGVVFVGSEKGNYDHIKDYAKKLGIEESVHFLGFVSTEELVALYKQAFCLTFATFCGPDNLPPLEAFALGCPVVASRVKGATEQLGDNALLFDPADAHSLAERIVELRGNSALRAGLVASGRCRALRHTWDQYASDIVAALNEFAYIRRSWK